MFSGLTNQVSNWMGKKAEDGSELPADQQQQPPTVENAAEGVDPAGSGGVGSKLEMLAGVKSQVASSMSGWLSGGIPGLNRGAGGAAGEDQMAEGVGAEGPAVGTTAGDQATSSGDGATDNVKDDDASRWVAGATGGADSGPGSLGGTPTEEGQQPFGAVSTKALAGAKSLGGFLYSAVNKAGKSVAEAGAKIKKTVEENKQPALDAMSQVVNNQIRMEEDIRERLIAELNKEQEAFIAGKPGEKGEAVAPWIGAPNEDALREECLALSTDRRNFVRAPPPGVDFPWDFEAVQPMAQATLALDPNLETMRFELVPKVISEENFWRNYFYRVSLLRQSHEMNAMASESTESNPGQFASSDSVEQTQGSSGETIKDGPGASSASASKTSQAKDESGAKDGLEEGVKNLGIQSRNKEEEWERELEAELKDYEVVPGSQDSKSKDDWEDEGQIDDFLNEDLK
ncbi:synapse-associated protein of 47 kDa isoform X3 [Copidosoma floridanum]|uniref:synapse-associated protein of 47 kDa isoform X3 n=1 Tax=Copidosoma floridanum TaxID=29053 RepID=UPI0006C95CDC|nr:synapse-associated protein of 47 kDa isoform X3 [Copidosoma floridanum]